MTTALRPDPGEYDVADWLMDRHPEFDRATAEPMAARHPHRVAAALREGGDAASRDLTILALREQIAAVEHRAVDADGWQTFGASFHMPQDAVWMAREIEGLEAKARHVEVRSIIGHPTTLVVRHRPHAIVYVREERVALSEAGRAALDAERAESDAAHARAEVQAA